MSTVIQKTLFRHYMYRSKLASLAKSISDEVKEHHEEVYQPGTAKEVFGAWGIAGGATDDW